MYENTQDQLSKGLESGELDLAIMYDLDLDPTCPVSLAHPPPRVVLPAGHRLADGGPLDLAQLTEDPMVLLDAPPSSGDALARRAKAGFRAAGRVPGPHLRDRPLVRRPGVRRTLLLERPSANVTYEGMPVVVKDIGSPVIPAVAVDVVWHPESLPSKASRTLVALAVRLAKAGSLGLPRES